MSVDEVLSDISTRQWGTPWVGRDLPEILRRLVSGDPEVSEGARWDLGDALFNSGTVMADAFEVTPYLARLASLEVPQTPSLLALLGIFADKNPAISEKNANLRDVVADQLSLISPLLDSRDPATRRAASWSIAQCQRIGPDTDKLFACFESEADPDVAGDLVLACTFVDPARAGWMFSLIRDASCAPGVRVSALMAAARSGSGWSPEFVPSAVSLMPFGAAVAETQWFYGENLAEYLVRRLWRAGHKANAITILTDGMRRQGKAAAGARDEAFWAAVSLGNGDGSSVRESIFREMLALVEDEELHSDVTYIANEWGMSSMVNEFTSNDD